MSKKGELIDCIDQLRHNIHTVEKCLAGLNGEEKAAWMRQRIGMGTDLVAYHVGSNIHFAPSRFLGYVDNDVQYHINNNQKDGRITSRIIDKLLGQHREENTTLDEAFIAYCREIGTTPKNMINASRHYWDSLLSFEHQEITEFLEGSERQVTSNRYERDPEARKACLALHGHTCAVCGFNFEAVYGEIGKGFIHVHHIVPLSVTGKYKVNPETDLIPVCPNCHAMLHKNGDIPYSVEELKNVMKTVR